MALTDKDIKKIKEEEEYRKQVREKLQEEKLYREKIQSGEINTEDQDDINKIENIKNNDPYIYITPKKIIIFLVLFILFIIYIVTRPF